MDGREYDYADDAVVVETAETVAREQRREKRGDLVVVVIEDHQVGVDAAQDVLLLLVHVACGFEEMNHLRYQLHALQCYSIIDAYVIIAVDCEKLVDENAREVVIHNVFRIHLRLVHSHAHLLSDHNKKAIEHCT